MCAESVAAGWTSALSVQCSSLRQWQPDEMDLFSELSVQIAITVQQAEFLAQTQAALAKEKELNLERVIS
jgi:GAF domain-containing protein